MFVTYYTRADLGGEIGGYVQLAFFKQESAVFIDWDDYIVAWTHQGEVEAA